MTRATWGKHHVNGDNPQGCVFDTDLQTRFISWLDVTMVSYNNKAVAETRRGTRSRKIEDWTWAHWYYKQWYDYRGGHYRALGAGPLKCRQWVGQTDLQG